MTEELKFYEVRTENGTFFIRAPRASAARELACKILTTEANDFYLFCTYDIDFTDTITAREPS